MLIYCVRVLRFKPPAIVPLTSPGAYLIRILWSSGHHLQNARRNTTVGGYLKKLFHIFCCVEVPSLAFSTSGQRFHVASRVHNNNIILLRSYQVVWRRSQVFGALIKSNSDYIQRCSYLRGK